MKFQVTQQNLSNCLKNVSPFVNNRGHQLEILRKNILLKAEKNLLNVSATNLNTSIIEHVQGSCTRDGIVTVPVNLLRDYIQNLPSNEKITLETSDEEKPKTTTGTDEVSKNGKLTITCSTAKATINTSDPREYPVFPVHKKQQLVLEIEANRLKDNLNQIIFASSQDINRPILTSIYLHVFEGNFFLATTDSSRLAEKRITSKSKAKPGLEEFQMLIPRQNLQSLERVLATQDNKNVSIYLSSHQKEGSTPSLLFIINEGEIEIHTSLIEGTYPDYRKLIPDDFVTEIVVKKEDFMGAAKRTELFSQENSYIILDWQDDKDKLHVKSSVSQIGGGEENIPAQITNSKPKAPDHQIDMTITLNVKYLQDVLQILEFDYVKLNLNPALGRLGPCLIQACQKDKKPDDTYRHVIMPIRS